ncbi:MAG: ribonuclease H-like domain-containing protein [Lachnospiraceae bacterium]|nr:ribonuclease H-like domain-containing protein [Lachnospiraceae bacterium]
MITFTESVPAFDTCHEILGYIPGNSLFFDIETTGFSPASSMVFLIGMLFCENGGWKLTQLLAENPEDEPSLLRAFFDTAARYDTLIHFNGSTFDLPYLIKKAGSYGLAHELGRLHSLDLYQTYRPLGKFFSLERMNQRSLEAFLGWQREDRLTGKHMVSLFQKYAASREPGIRDLLLLHNHDDMLGMTHLLCLSSYLLLFDGHIKEVQKAELIPSSENNEDSADIPSCLELSFTLSRPVPAAVSADGAYRLYARDDSAVLQIPFFSGTLCHFFPDYKNYYYLPLEDQAIHKSVASYVDKAYRTPAKASNCYIKKSGQFLPQPEEIISPAFQCSLGSSELYFAYSDSLLSESETLNAYISAVLRSLQ